MVHRRLPAALCAAVIGLLFSVALPTAAHATPADDARWGIAPANTSGPDGRNAFDLKGPPGQQILDHVTVGNLGDKPVTVTVYPTDAFTTTDGSFALLTADQRPHDVGAWTDLTTHQYSIEPHKQLIIPFRLNIPANATPGDHAGGIIASVLGDGKTSDGNQVQVDRRIAARVYVRVVGPVRPHAEVSAVAVSYKHGGNPFGAGDVVVTYLVRNSGNIRFHGKAKARLQAPLGVGLGESPAVDVPDLLPGAEVRLTATVHHVVPVGRITATVTLNPVSQDGNLPAATRSGSVWTSLWLVLAVLLILAAAIALLVWRLRRRSPGRSRPPQQTRRRPLQPVN